MASYNHTTSGRNARENRKIIAREHADLRQVRTSAQQLKELDARLGKGVGAAKERARLQAAA